MLLSLNYCRRGNRHGWVIVNAEMLVMSNCCRRVNMHVCVIVNVELLASWS